MNRPLALIQGSLAQPNARLLRGLPPPYGVYRGPVRPTTQRRPQPAFRDSGRRISPQEPHTWLAPGQKFRFFYKSPPPRDYSSRLDAELAEARNYLEMDKARECSSRLDHVLGATLFFACSIVLAWLLTSNAARDTGKLATVTIAEPSVTTRGTPVVLRPRASGKSVQPPVAELMPSVAQIAPSPANLASAGGIRNEPKPSLQAERQATPTLSAQHAEPYLAARASTYDTASSHATKVNARIKAVATPPTDSQLPAANPIETLADDYQSPSRSPRPAIPPAISAQPEQAARSPAAAAVQAALRDWAAQQRHAHVTARTNTSTAYNANPLGTRDTEWNTHLIQRRITDNPTAFDLPNTQP